MTRRILREPYLKQRKRVFTAKMVVVARPRDGSIIKESEDEKFSEKNRFLSIRLRGGEGAICCIVENSR
jgi:hypothetical protein